MEERAHTGLEPTTFIMQTDDNATEPTGPILVTIYIPYFFLFSHVLTGRKFYHVQII